MAEQWALVSDFDGTVSADDFFTLAAGRYFTDEMLEPWREYLSGRKKHFDALNEMFGRLRGLPDLPACVKNIPLDSWSEVQRRMVLDEHTPLHSRQEAR